VLKELPSPRVLVLGDMGEVGSQGPAFHREIGAYAKAFGVESLFGIGEMTQDAVVAFGTGGAYALALDQLLDLLREHDKPGASILVKGSRFMKMERVTAALSGIKAGAH
jgi:UDP-N-acetylmuramoyl-tripeptide--D-alanyl-D-alanine ligase